MYLLDTSIVVDYVVRGNRKVIELVNNLPGELSSSYVCLAELYEGVERAREKEKSEKAILEFFSSLSTVYGLDQEIAKTFGNIRTQLKKKGEVIEDLDILIAATSLAYGLTLVTKNSRHFERVRGLDILTAGAS